MRLLLDLGNTRLKWALHAPPLGWFAHGAVDWQPDMARRFFAFNRAIGGEIVACEFFNEPTAPFLAAVPKGWGAADYARDFHAFHAFARDVAPGMLVLGPGSVGEAHGKEGDLTTRQLLQASSPAVDVFSYHHYGAASLRCARISTDIP